MKPPENMDYQQKLVLDIDNMKYVQLYSEKYCLTQLVEDLEWLAKTVSFSKSFSDYLLYANKSNNIWGLECPVESIITNPNLDIVETSPFLKYKEDVKSKYRNLVYILKHLYKNALELPDSERVINTITSELHIENDIYLKHPDFIMDHYIYHTYSHTHISENYEKVLNILKAFEYLYYKTINYIAEMEFDAQAVEIPIV